MIFPKDVCPTGIRIYYDSAVQSTITLAQSAGAVEYTDCTSAES